MPGPGMVISTLARDQVAAAIELWHASDLTRSWNDPRKDLDRALAGPSSTVLAGMAGDRLVATALVGHDGHRGWVYYLAVRPEARGRGHGREMMRACEDWLAERDMAKVNLMGGGDNGEACGFYSALDYDHDDVVVLSRRLG